MYVVVEQVCEVCGQINAHLTSQCPHIECKPFTFSSFASLITWATSRMDTLMWFAGQFAR